MGIVLGVPLDDLPDWLPAWCLDHLGGEPAGVLFQRQQVSTVFGLRLADGRDVVVKARADEGGPCRVLRRRPGWPGAGFRVPGRSRRWSASVRWRCTPRSSGPAVRCCTAARRV